jgi:hypothetical protein
MYSDRATSLKISDTAWFGKPGGARHQRFDGRIACL